MRTILLTLSAITGALALGCAGAGGATGALSQASDEIRSTVGSGTTTGLENPHIEYVGDMRFEYQLSMGANLSVFDIPVLRSSNLVSTRPDWSEPYYVSFNSMNILREATAEDYEDGRRITIVHKLAEEYNSPFEAVETITFRPDNSYSVRLDYRFSSDEEAAILEWRTGYFTPQLVAGLPFRVTGPEGVTEGVQPFEPAGATAAETTVGQAFEELRIFSQLGEIVIESNPADNLILFDYRKNRHAEGAPSFWLGYLGRGITPNQDHSHGFTIHFPESLDPAGEVVAEAAADVELIPTDSARVPTRERNYIIPAPKEIAFTGEEVPLGPGTVIYTGANPGRGVETAVAFLERDLLEIYGVEPRVVRGPAPPVPPQGAILLGETDRHAAPARLLHSHGLNVPPHEEGYALRVGDGHAAIAANTEQGVFYGVTTLVQLIGAGANGTALRGAEIVDWPSLDFRGIHALSGKDAGDQISKAVRELLARYKMNSFIWECQYIVWDNAPELAHPRFAMEKEDARKVVDASREYFVNLIPLIQSLGHSEWIFVGGHNLDIAEDPETPYAYMPTNPRTYEFIFTIFQEALDFFEPNGFHIGHDEVTMRGRFPYRSADSGMTTTELIMMDIEKLNDWFRERSVDVYMWGDMFLHRSEVSDAAFAPTPEIARERRDLLPRDIIITDWHYAPVPPEEFTSLGIWHDAGFRTIGAGWFRPDNLKNLVLASIQNGSLGYLQTTWAGFNFAIDNNEANWHQYWAYITAAHYSWSGDETDVEDLPFVPKEEFINTWFGVKPLTEQKEGFHVDLGDVFNRQLVDDEQGSGWLGYGPENDLRALPEGDLLMDETTFHLTRNARGEGAVLLAGKLNPEGVYPEAIELRTGGTTASELRFLMTTSFPTTERNEVATISVRYADGSTAEMPLRYGQEIFTFTDIRAGANSRIAWEGESTAGTAMRLWDVAWMNPHPGREITAIRLTSAGTEASPILLAVTGVR